MTVNRSAIAAATLWGGGVLNLGVVVLKLWFHDYGGAAVQSVVVVFLGAWIGVVHKIDAWVDARLAEAVAQRRMAENMAQVMERQTAVAMQAVRGAVDGKGERPN